MPSLLSTLSTLYGTVRTRLANHKRYVKLAGRLELLNAQIRERNARKMALRRAVHVYREDHDEADEEDEDAEEGGVTIMDILDDDDLEEDEEDHHSNCWTQAPAGDARRLKQGQGALEDEEDKVS